MLAAAVASAGNRPRRLAPVVGMRPVRNDMRLVSFCALLVAAHAACDDKKSTATVDASAANASASAVPAVSASAAASASAAPVTEGKAPDAVAAQHILIAYKGAKDAPKTITRSKADAKKRAEEVVAKAKAPGADFTALVNEYSDDPGSKSRSGSVGKFTREKMTKPFSDAAFALKVDEVSNVVETDFGFHVIKRNQ